MIPTEPGLGFLMDGKRLPKALAGHREALYAALTVPLLAEWPETVDFLDAKQPAAVAHVLLEPLHQELLTAHIGYVFKQTMGSADRIDLGKLTKASGALGFLAGVDFVMVINWTAWKAMAGLQRVALIDHELCHGGRDDNGDFTVLHHDVEEFGGVVQRWGLWTAGLQRFADVVKDQLEIFTEASQ